LDVQGLCYGPGCEKLKDMTESLGAVLYIVQILDWKILVSGRAIQNYRALKTS